MRGRLITASVLGIAAIPCALLGLIDPIEGGLALIGGAVLVASAWLLARQPVPRLAWIPWTIAMSSGVVAITIALASWPPPASGNRDLWSLGPVLLTTIAVYEISVLVVVVGTIIYAARLVKAATRGMDPFHRMG